MQEAFLHYIWQHQYFDKRALRTTDNEEIVISYPGYQNTNAGPDFLEGKVIVGGIAWTGSIEIHTKASFWEDHKHQHDTAYNNVILHVVWQNDKSIQRSDGSSIPTLELKNLIDLELINRYNKLLKYPAQQIPCERFFADVSELKVYSQLDRVLYERLGRKSKVVLQWLHEVDGDWEQTAYRLLLKTIGLKVNEHPFEVLSQKLPYTIVRKYATHPTQLEALLFGTAGFLNSGELDYKEELYREFKFLVKKHQLDFMHEAEWRFMRMRPAAFPTVRLAQLSSILCQTTSLFHKVVDSDLKALKEWLQVKPTQFWQNHYHFHKPTKCKLSGMGEATFNLLIINWVVPLLSAYAAYQDDESYQNRAIRLLEQTQGEHNRIVKVFKSLGYNYKNAFDSQALLELYNSYCLKKRCLNCEVGVSIVNNKSQ